MQYKPCTNWNSLQGVEVLIDVETYEYFSVHSSGSEGVLVLIQHYRDIPLMRKESFVLAPGTEADVGLSITEIITTQVRIFLTGWECPNHLCEAGQYIRLISNKMWTLVKTNEQAKPLLGNGNISFEFWCQKVSKYLFEWNTPSPWLTLLLVLGKSCVKQNSC